MDRPKIALWASAWMGLAIVAVLGAAAFAAGLTGGFVLDDPKALLENPVVAGRVPMVEAFTRTFWGAPLGANPPAYRPLAVLSFAADRRLFGWSALAFHISSLLAYLGLLGAGWVLARRCWGTAAALAAMAFFAVMPIHTETVTSIVGRADTLAVAFAVLALLAVAPTIVDGKNTPAWRLGLGALAFGAGLLCKESVAVVPIIVGLCAAYRPGRFVRMQLPTGVLLAVLVAYLALRIRLQPGTFAYTPPDDVLAGSGLWAKVGYGLEQVARYAQLIVAPVGLCTGRKYAEVYRPTNITLTMVFGAVVLGLAVWTAWRAHRKRAYPFVPAALLAWFVLAGLVFAMPESMADRFMLFPSLFLCLAAAPALVAFWNQGRLRQGIVLAAVAFQLVMSNVQAATWRNDGVLLAHAVETCPDSVHNHFRFAEYLSDRGQTAEAVWHYAVASQGVAHFPRPWTHPAKDEEWSLPLAVRMRDLHKLLHVDLDAPTWRERFHAYLINQGRPREAALVEATVAK